MFFEIYILFLPTNRPCLFMTLVTQILCAPINYLCWALQSRCTMTHLVPPKCSFHTCTCAIVFTLSMPCFKKAPSVSNSSLFVKATQPIKWACRFELPRTPIWPNPVFCKWHPIVFERIINQPKAVLNKQRVVLTIITNIKMIFLDHITWLRSAIPSTINARLSMSIQYMYEDGDLVGVIILTLYLFLRSKCVILSKVYHR